MDRMEVRKKTEDMEAGLGEEGLAGHMKGRADRAFSSLLRVLSLRRAPHHSQWEMWAQGSEMLREATHYQL